MMYVKHMLGDSQAGDDNRETIYEATKVARISGKTKCGFFLTAPDLWQRRLEGGVIYVMNEAGKTIQTYDLRKDPLRILDTPAAEGV